MSYELRGNRVAPMNAFQIETTALRLAKIFKLTKRRRKKCDKSFELLSELGVTLSVIENHEWLGLTKGHFDPTTMTISVPEVIYEDACKGGKDALFVMLHELGHLFLMHRPLLHSSSIQAEKFEDAEWQADTFADAILEYMGYRSDQLTFDFYM
jgi:hypothetical protein